MSLSEIYLLLCLESICKRICNLQEPKSQIELKYVVQNEFWWMMAITILE